MKTRIARFLVHPLLLLSILISAPTTALAQEKAEPDRSGSEERGIEWRTDIEAARKHAQKEGKPILYYYRCEP